MGKSIVDELIASQEPRFELPRPATHPELIAAAMMAAGHMKAADLGVGLGIALGQRSLLDAGARGSAAAAAGRRRPGRSVGAEYRLGDAQGGSDRGGGARAHRRPGSRSRQDRSHALSVLWAGVPRRVTGKFRLPSHAPATQTAIVLGNPQIC